LRVLNASALQLQVHQLSHALQLLRMIAAAALERTAITCAMRRVVLTAARS